MDQNEIFEPFEDEVFFSTETIEEITGGKGDEDDEQQPTD